MSDKAKKYYEKNREKILAKNKLRYKADPQYREEVIKRTVASRKKRTEEVKRQKALEKADKKIWKKFQIKGKVYECCRIGHLAKLLNREVQTIKLWEKLGFPKAITKSGQRYYTREQVNITLSAWKKHNDNIYMFVEVLQKNWQRF